MKKEKLIKELQDAIFDYKITEEEILKAIREVLLAREKYECQTDCL